MISSAMSAAERSSAAFTENPKSEKSDKIQRTHAKNLFINKNYFTHSKFSIAREPLAHIVA